jgi:cytochrome c oxidase subunit 2
MWNDFPLFPKAASAYASEVDHLYLALLGFSLLFTVGIFTAILYLSIKYRRRSPDDVAVALEDPTRLEVAWTVLPFVLSIGLLVWGVDLFWQARRPAKDPIEIAVVAKQWMWKVRQSSGAREIDALHIPVGHPIRWTLATEDVIHSFYVPAFRLKQDVVPGRYTTLNFEPNRVGEYHLFCAEYCGTSHSQMKGTVTVMAPADFERWLRSKASAETPLAAGRRHFEKLGCVSCHGPKSTEHGPALAGLMGRAVRLADGRLVIADESYLRESIVEPEKKVVAGYRPLMPPFRGRLNEEEIFDLVSYVSSIPEPGP